MAEQFIRANDGAEFTASHTVHGDTEYRYDVKGDGAIATVKVSAFKWDTGREADRWEVEYVGPLAEFIDKHAATFSGWADEGDPPYSPFRLVSLGDYRGAAWLNVHTAARRLTGEYGPLRHLRAWSKMPSPMPVGAANWQGCLGEVAALLAAFPELATDETTAMLAGLGAKCPANA